MRRLIESLTPEHRRIYWRWVGGVFAVYMVLVAAAAGVFVSHEPARRLAQETAATVATDGQPAATAVSTTQRQAARY
jgi:hypothetical protein